MTRTVAITGAASGIGKAAARRLASQGWEVFALDVAPIPAAPNVTPLACDVSDTSSVTTAFDRIAARAPRLGALICCAGILRIGPLAEMAVEEFDRVFAINTRGTWLCAKAAFPLLRAAAQPGRRRGWCSCPPSRRCAQKYPPAPMPRRRRRSRN